MSVDSGQHRPQTMPPGPPGPETRLEALRALLADGLAAPHAALVGAAHARASRVLSAGTDTDATLRPAATLLAARTIVELAADSALQPGDAGHACSALAETCEFDRDVAAVDLYRAAAGDRTLLQVPPGTASEILLRLLLELCGAAHVSLWQRGARRSVDCVVSLGAEPGRAERGEARTLLGRGSALRVLGRRLVHAAPVVRFGRADAALVLDVGIGRARAADVLLETAAEALGPVLERRHLLARSAERERALVTASEKRLMRLGFDLHDGPVQDVLALADEIRYVRDQVYPFVLESHRELLHGRFDDVLLRLVELDRQLREIAHSLESKSIVSRPLGEVLHREVDSFRERGDIAASLDLRGDPDWLTPSQRIAIFRAVQEGLTNVREHSGAAHVDIRVRVRRASVEVRMHDDGTGFDVERALARAAERGRLGIVGIGERVRLLGGTFDLDSRPGGPTTLTLTLARWEPPVSPEP